MSDIVWGELIRFKFKSKFAELDSIVDKSLEQIRKNSKKPQVNLSEIILIPEPNRPMNKTLELASEIIKSVNRGETSTPSRDNILPPAAQAVVRLAGC